jgi:hypothetical protein
MHVLKVCSAFAAITTGSSRPGAALRRSIKTERNITMKRFELQCALRGEGKNVRLAGGLHRYGYVVLSVEPVQTSLSLA